MAVYTILTVKEVSPLLAKYSIGQATSMTPLEAGTTNTIYKLETTKGSYVLTLFEDPEEALQLEWLPRYKSFLAYHGLPIARIMPTADESFKSTLKNKTAIISEYIEGKEGSTSPENAAKVGAIQGKMNRLSKDYPHLVNPPWGVAGLTEKRKLVNEDTLLKCERKALKAFDENQPEWEHEPHDLPVGIIHADLFPDNVLFLNGEVSGILDFYKAGTDFLAYDLAQSIIAWGFDDQDRLNENTFKSFYKNYTATRPLSTKEKDAFKGLLLRACCSIILMRILRSQILRKEIGGNMIMESHINDSNDITPRSPEAYLKRLMFLKENNLQALIDA